MKPEIKEELKAVAIALIVVLLFGLFIIGLFGCASGKRLNDNYPYRHPHYRQQ